MTPSSNQPQPSLSGTALLRRYLVPQRGWVSVLIVLLLGSIGLQLINPLFVRRFLDSVETGEPVNQLLTAAMIFMSIAIVRQLVELAATYVGELVAWTATNELRADLALHCLRLDMAFHKSIKPGELIERVDGDVNQLANFFSRLVVRLTGNLLLVVAVTIALTLLNWRVGLSIALILPFGVLAIQLINRRAIVRWERRREAEASLFGDVEEWLNGLDTIQTNRATPFMWHKLVARLRRRLETDVAAHWLHAAMVVTPMTVFTLAYIVAHIWGTRLFNLNAATIGTVYLFFYYIDVIRSPLFAAMREVQDLQRAAASIRRIAALFDESSELPDGTIATAPAGALGVQFNGVTFAYADEPDRPVLQQIQLDLAPGQVLGLLGRTGSGKSTLSKLLFRLYDVTSGEIRLYNDEDWSVNLPSLQQTVLRERIGMVTQDVELFHANIRDNLTLFDDSIDDADIEAVLAEIGLNDWLAQQPAGLDTHIDGSGGLSAGQAQLLAFARVFLRDPGLVILDEASSRLDPATERLIERAIDRLLTNRTAIIIAHRLATVQRADDILILANGEMQEYGRRDVLAATPSSHFAELLRTGLVETEESQ